MWIARGIESNKVYAKNKLRSEVFRYLINKYPSTDFELLKKKVGREARPKQVLPEPITITKGDV